MKVLIEVPDFEELEFLEWGHVERGQWTLDNLLEPWCWTDVTPSHERKMVYVTPESLSEKKLAEAKEKYPVGSYFRILNTKPILTVDEVHQDMIFKHKIFLGFTDAKNGFNYAPINECEPIKLEGI